MLARAEALMNQEEEAEWILPPSPVQEEQARLRTQRRVLATWKRWAKWILNSMWVAFKTKTDKLIQQTLQAKLNPVPMAMATQVVAQPPAPRRQVHSTALPSGIGQPLQRSTADRTWNRLPCQCKHPADKMKKTGGTNKFMGWLCMECGSRWKRLPTPDGEVSLGDGWMGLDPTRHIPLECRAIKTEMEEKEMPEYIVTPPLYSAPECEKCFVRMMAKMSTGDAWHWGCRNYPKCEKTYDVLFTLQQQKAMLMMQGSVPVPMTVPETPMLAPQRTMISAPTSKPRARPSLRRPAPEDISVPAQMEFTDEWTNMI